MISLVWLVGVGCTLRSGLGIPAHEQFVLGDNPHGPFRVRVTNTSAVPVSIVTTSADGATLEARTLSPGDSARARFGSAEAAVFVNDADEVAALSVSVRGDVGLSMGYTPLR